MGKGNRTNGGDLAAARAARSASAQRRRLENTANLANEINHVIRVTAAILSDSIADLPVVGNPLQNHVGQAAMMVRCLCPCVYAALWV